jgi:hypothetical protein
VPGMFWIKDYRRVAFAGCLERPSVEDRGAYNQIIEPYYQ